jgi:hypothetical protein
MTAYFFGLGPVRLFRRQPRARLLELVHSTRAFFPKGLRAAYIGWD